VSLSRRIVIKIAGLLLGLVVLSGVSLWGLVGLQDDVRLARDEFRDLRALQRAIFHAAAARVGSELVDRDEEAVLAELEIRDEEIDAFLDALTTRREPDVTDRGLDRPAIRASVTGLRVALEELHNSKGDYATAVRSFEDVLGHLDELAGKLDLLIAEAQTQADSRLRSTMEAIAVIAILILVVITWINVSHYRSMVVPLQGLHEGVSRIAAGQFHDRLPLTGADEFQTLARDFNRMAEQLEELYTDLEQKVEAKSRALVRSERLASVGYLAAGVAHEINNPLNIISGYAELTLKRLERDGRSPDTDDAAKSLATIRDEAFRCKDITEKLLSLSRSSESPRERVSIRRIASDVATMVSCLSQYRDRRVTLEMDSDDDLPVLGNANELKQVLLNLTLNALQAVEPNCGVVVLEGDTSDGRVTLRVRDNGRGMTPETIEKIFEPFFTCRRGSGGHGVGLGLSISYAIIESHGGRLSAESAGTDKGSCFTIELSCWSGKGNDGKTY
jgi:signal transduction histidine kinase